MTSRPIFATVVYTGMTRLLVCLCILTFAIPCWASRILKDETGRSVTVPDHPHRIICLVPSITDSVFSIGAGDDVVAISDYVKYPPEALHKPSVGSISNPSVETILSLHPDLVLGMPQSTQRSILDQIQSLGIPVYLVDPHGIAGILQSIISLGQAVNRKPQAATVVARLKERIAAVRASVQEKPVIKVFAPVSYDPVITIGKGAFITEIIEAAGGESITSDLAQEWPQISMEAVVARAPEALLLVRGGRITIEILKDRPGWSALPAVRQKRVYFVDKRVEFPSPVAIDALEDLAKQFHPGAEFLTSVHSIHQPAGCREVRCESATTP
jgi:iron complex transport system substrate-binding protein